MVLSLCLGAWLMVVYDCLRLFRLMVRHGSVLVGIEDFFYWIYAGLAVFMLLYEQNDGVLRAYVIAGVFGGMILYDRLVSRFFFLCLKKAGKCIRMVRKRLRRLMPDDRTSRKVGD